MRKKWHPKMNLGSKFIQDPDLSGNSGELPKRCFVNVYSSDGGKKFIGSEWSSYQEAIDESINGGPNNYIETVEIIRKP